MSDSHKPSKKAMKPAGKAKAKERPLPAADSAAAAKHPIATHIHKKAKDVNKVNKRADIPNQILW